MATAAWLFNGRRFPAFDKVGSIGQASAVVTATTNQSDNASATSVYSVSGWRYAALWPIAFMARLWAKTLRMRMQPEVQTWLRDSQSPGVVIFWHNGIFISAEMHRRYRRHRTMTGLVSASNDGAWLAAFFKLAGIQSIRGSSSRRSLEAAREMLRAIAHGSDLAVTPDGPRGPCYDFKAGAALMAKKAGVPILLIAPQYTRVWRLKSWDRFVLPKPFSRVEVLGEVIDLESEGLQQLPLADLASVLRERLWAKTPEAEKAPQSSHGASV